MSDPSSMRAAYAGSRSRPSPAIPKHADDVFFTVASLLMLTIVFLGFASSYFLRGVALSHQPSALVHVHGLVFSSWMLLFVIQCALVSAGHLPLHRMLGVAGALIAATMVVLGILTTFATLARGLALPPALGSPASFLVGNVIEMLFFGGFVALAICKRKDRIVHKRAMLIAHAALLPPALFRMAFPVVDDPVLTFPAMVQHPALIGLIPLASILALLIFDLAMYRRVVAVTVVGGALLLAMNPLADIVAKTTLAQRLDAWAQSPR